MSTRVSFYNELSTRNNLHASRSGDFARHFKTNGVAEVPGGTTPPSPVFKTLHPYPDQCSRTVQASCPTQLTGSRPPFMQKPQKSCELQAGTQSGATPQNHMNSIEHTKPPTLKLLTEMQLAEVLAASPRPARRPRAQKILPFYKLSRGLIRHDQNQCVKALNQYRVNGHGEMEDTND